jgi:hypothetical protein
MVSTSEAYDVGIPYKRGDGTYCGDVIAEAAELSGLDCYTNSLLGSEIWINCRSKPQARSVEQNLTTIPT